MPEKCYKCSREIIPPNPISRYNGNSYHPNCFICNICGNSIAGINFFRDPVNGLRCLDCEDKYGVKCAKCKLSFKPGASSKKLDNNRYFHNDCFLCNKCNLPIVNEFHECAGTFTCPGCYDKEVRLNAPTCNKCNNIIITKSIKYLQKDYHTECFTCILCEEVITDVFYRHYDKEPICFKCNEIEVLNNAVACFKCKNLIKEYGVSCSNRNYHENCLTCVLCDKVVKNSFITNSTKEPYCEECYIKAFAKNCFKCSGIIHPALPTYTFQDNSYHKECLVCDNCNDNIAEATFYKKGLKWLCEKCKNMLKAKKINL